MKLYEAKINDIVYIPSISREVTITTCNPYEGWIEVDSDRPWKRYCFKGDALNETVILNEDDEPLIDLPKNYQKKWWQFWKVI